MNQDEKAILALDKAFKKYPHEIKFEGKLSNDAEVGTSVHQIVYTDEIVETVPLFIGTVPQFPVV